jgi:signal transduction histidine kinase
LLAYSRTRSGDRKFEATRLDMIVEEVKSDFKEELKQKNATIEASGLSEVWMIRFQFRQLLQNLVSNALKFSNSERKDFFPQLRGVMPQQSNL